MKHIKAATNTKNSKLAMKLEDVLYEHRTPGTRFDIEDIKTYIAVYGPEFGLDGKAWSAPVDILVGAGVLLPVFTDGRLSPVGYHLRVQPKPARATTVTMTVEEIHDQLSELTDELARRAS